MILGPLSRVMMVRQPFCAKNMQTSHFLSAKFSPARTVLYLQPNRALLWSNRIAQRFVTTAGVRNYGTARFCKTSNCSKYHSMSFLVAQNTISMNFLVVLFTHCMNLLVALNVIFSVNFVTYEPFTNQTFKTTECTWIYLPNANLLWQKDKNHGTVPLKYNSSGTF